MAATSTIQSRIERQKEEAARRKKEMEEAGAAAPVTPLGTAGLGATPDQAKMAGTPAAKVGMGSSVDQMKQEEAPTALQTAASQATPAAGAGDTLEEARGEQSFDDATRDSAQESAAEFSENMSAFGSLGSRVEALVRSEFAGTGETFATGLDFEYSTDDILAETVPGTDPGAVQRMMNALQNTTSSDEIAQILYSNKEMFKSPSSGTMKVIQDAYKNDPTTLRQMTAKLVADEIVDPDKVNIDTLISSGMLTVTPDGVIAELGITEQEAEEILGADWKMLTPEGIGEEMEMLQDEQLSVAENIRERLSDPNLPPQNRVALLEELRRMGAIGALEYEQQAEEATEAAKQAGMIFMGGEIQDINELLEDTAIQKSVTDFLSNPDAPKNKKWAELNPEFSEWLNREISTLNLSKEQLEGGLQNFKQIQEAREKKLDENPGNLNRDLMVQLFGAWGLEDINYNSNPIYRELLAMSPDEQAEATEFMNANGISHLGGRSGNALREAMRGVSGDLPAVENYKDAQKAFAGFTADTPVETLTKNVFGMEKSDVEQQIRNLKLKLRPQKGGEVGTPKQRSDWQVQYDLLTGMFDRDGDDKVDSDIYTRIQSMLAEAPGSTAEALSVKDKYPLTRLQAALRNTVEGHQGKGNVLDSELLGEGGARVGDDNQVTVPELQKMAEDDSIELEQMDILASGEVRDQYGVNMEAFRQAQSRKASRKISIELVPEVATINGTDLSGAEFSRSSQEHIPTVKNAKAKLRDIINSNSHGALKTEAKAQLKNIAKKTTAPAKGEDWEKVVLPNMETLHNQVKFKEYPKGDKYKDLFVKGADGFWHLKFPGPHVVSNQPQIIDRLQNITERWMTWRNYADSNHANGDEFIETMDLADKNQYFGSRGIGTDVHRAGENIHKAIGSTNTPSTDSVIESISSWNRPQSGPSRPGKDLS